MTILLALDPSIRAPGAALFRDGVLVACRAFEIRESRADVLHRARSAAAAVAAWAGGVLGAARVGEVATEWPQVYAPGKGRGDPADLVPMAAVCGALAALYPAAAVRAYLPGEWCRLPKSRSHAEAHTSVRGARILSRLSPEERALVPRSHDAVDAAGVGLHHLGRLGALRVYPGAVDG